MLWRVSKKPNDLTSLVTAMFTGVGSVSVIVKDKWGHFQKMGRFGGRFVIEPASEVIKRTDVKLHAIRRAREEDSVYLEQLRATRWRPWHNCFSVLRPFWRAK